MNNLKLLKISEEANDELATVLEHNISKNNSVTTI